MAVKINLVSNANWKYVRAHNDGVTPLYANRTGIGTWEMFYLIEIGGGNIALQAFSNLKYVCAENGGASPLVANRNQIGLWETFNRIDLGNGKIALKSLANGRFVCAENAGAGPLIANRTAIGDWEKFDVKYPKVDLWIAFTSFANNFPNKVKLLTSGTGILLHKEVVEGNFLWAYELFPDYRFDPMGHPTWNKYGLAYIGDWEVLCCFETQPHYQNGSKWTQGIPRSLRYANTDSQEDSPRHNFDWYNLLMNCTTSYASTGEEWGRRYIGYMRDLSDASSQENMGWRWVCEIGYKDTPEKWVVDLGPSVNNFQPRYGIVGYTDGSTGAMRIFANIQDDQRLVARRCP